MWYETDPHTDSADRDITDVDLKVRQLLGDIPAQRHTEIASWIGQPLEALVFENDADGFYDYLFWLDGVETIQPGLLVGLTLTKLVRAGRWGGWTTNITAEALGAFLATELGHPLTTIRRYRITGPGMSDIELLPPPDA